MSLNADVTVVIIGRNEGQRLVACLNSLKAYLPNIVYVDSNSTDDSVKNAQKLGATVACLDLSKPFTAARARNFGARQAAESFPDTVFIQFVDGDCEVAPSWISEARDFLLIQKNVAVVCGRRREKNPEASVYNMLCDMEWNTPIGETKACGGDALIRKSVFDEVGGFRESLIAGEEPELCVRIRKAGHKIWRLDAEMTVHDVNMMYFRQWWLRTMRGGYAFAEGAYIHGAEPERHWVAESRRAWLWGFIIPLIIAGMSLLKPKLAAALLLIYPLQWLRLSFKSEHSFSMASTQAFYLMLAKFAEAAGQVKFMLNCYTHKNSKIIEYKN